MNSKPFIGVFFGSRSPEHDVSIITGQLVIAGLKELGYPVVPIYISKEGKWLSGPELGSLEIFRKGTPIQKRFSGWTLDLAASPGKLVLKKGGFLKKRLVIDIAFPAFHGQNGEDGTMQGIFEIMQVPYVGCDVVSSAITIDKVLTKLLYQQFNIPTAEFVYFTKREWEGDKGKIIKNILQALRWPVFIKPSRLGSSIGIAKVKNEKDLLQAIEVALVYDEKVLVEQGIENVMDVTCAVLGNDDPLTSLLQESVFTSGFFSYEEKYLNKGGAQFGKASQNIFIPARLDADTTDRIKSLAKEIFIKFGCSGIARVDFLYDTASKKVYANEVNTLPGTLYHHLWKKSGIELGELLQKLLQLAQEKYEKRSAFVSTFKSSILQQTNLP